MSLLKKQVEELEERGYLVLDEFADLSEVHEVRSIFQRLFEKKAGIREGAFFDMLAGSGDGLPMSLVQIASPADYAPALAAAAFVREAEVMARQILGARAKLSFDLGLLKPANSGTDTPWHQDEAFRDPRFEYREITFWVPLQDTPVENGCMSFIPGSHKGAVLEHHSPGNDATVHALECCGNFDPGEAVACPLRAGGCTIHYGRTLHHAGANRSSQPRYVYILGFRVPPTPGREVRSFPWLTARRTNDGANRKRWMLRGGIFIIALRKWRKGSISSLAELRYGIQRSIRLLFE